MATSRRLGPTLLVLPLAVASASLPVALAGSEASLGPFDKFETQIDTREHARARLVSETTGLVPGTVAYLGLTFEIDDGWHIYWNGRNDTGFPVELELELPQGFERLETLHPVPKRYISPGDILDHVYENSVTLIVPIRVPEKARVGSTVRISGRADWLVCKEACIPGSADVSITLPVAAEEARTTKSGDARLFSSARPLIPKLITNISDPPRVRWEGEQLVIEAPEGGWIEFYPYRESASVRDPIGSQASNTGVLRLRTDAAESGRPVHGVVAWKVRDREKGGLKQIQAEIRLEPPGEGGT